MANEVIRPFLQHLSLPLTGAFCLMTLVLRVSRKVGNSFKLLYPGKRGEFPSSLVLEKHGNCEVSL